MARMLNFAGNSAALSDFNSANFAVPLPSSFLLLSSAGLLLTFRRRQ
jgi:hypothetical protein